MIVEATSTYWIGLDDTDEREYGCTTHDFNHLLDHLIDCEYDIVDPRLVRLWPFAPRRTRGNAALSAGVVTTNRSKLEAHLDQWFSTRFSDVTGEQGRNVSNYGTDSMCHFQTVVWFQV